MVRTPLAFSFLLIIAAVLAGCTEAPPEAVETGPVLPVLEEFRDCPWQYPDNTSADCEDHSVELNATTEYPMTWICTAESRTQGWSLHWNPIAMQHGLWYELPDNATGHTGVLYLRTNGETHLFKWPDAPQQGFLTFPVEFGDNATFRYSLHEFGYVTNGTTLNQGEPSQAWSLHDDQFWVIHRFDTDNGTYTFQNMTTTQFRIERADGEEGETTFHEVRPFELVGQDFALWVHHERSHTATSQGRADALIIDRFCQTGLG